MPAAIADVFGQIFYLHLGSVFRESVLGIISIMNLAKGYRKSKFSQSELLLKRI